MSIARRARHYQRLTTAAMLQLEEAQEQAAMRAELANWERKAAADQRIAEGYRMAVEAAWAKTAGTDDAIKAVDEWANKLSNVDPTEMPDLGVPTREQFASVATASTFARASAVVAAAEREEANAKSWAERVAAERAAVAAAQADVDELLAAIERKKNLAASKHEQAEEGVDNLRAALELAMSKSQSVSEDPAE